MLKIQAAMLAAIIFFVGRLGKSCFTLPYTVAYFPAIYLHLEGVANIRYFTHETWNGIKWNMENKTTNLIEWTVEDVKKEIQKTFNKDIAKKFEALTDRAAMLIICVAYNAIKLSDVARSQLQSSGKRLGLKNLNKEDKSSLVRLVAQRLLDQGYVKIVGSLKSLSRNDICKVKPF